MAFTEGFSQEVRLLVCSHNASYKLGLTTIQVVRLIGLLPVFASEKIVHIMDSIISEMK